MIRRAMVFALATVLSGCAMVGPDYQRPAVNLPGAYPEGERGASAELKLPADWWRLYKDSRLDDLVARGSRTTPICRSRSARIEEAEAVLREANALFFPEVDGGASASRARSSTARERCPVNSAIRSNFSLTATTSFELDFWGRLRRAAEAARAQYYARHGRDVVALTLAAGITHTYFLVRSLDAQILVPRNTAGRGRLARHCAHALQRGPRARARCQPGCGQPGFARRSGHRAAPGRAHPPSITGCADRMLDLQVEPGDLRALPAPPLPPAGLPSTLLDRRPDIREAEAQFEAANAQIGVAKAAQLPTSALRLRWGARAASSTRCFPRAAAWSLGSRRWARSSMPVAMRRAPSRRRRERARRQNRTKGPRERVREVSDALSNLRYADEAQRDLAEQWSRQPAPCGLRGYGTTPATRRISKSSTRSAR